MVVLNLDSRVLLAVQELRRAIQLASSRCYSAHRRHIYHRAHWSADGTHSDVGREEYGGEGLFRRV